MERAPRSGRTGSQPDSRTAAQLLKLQRLVESLVIQELDRGNTVAGAGAGSSGRTGSRPRPQQQQHTDEQTDRQGSHAHGDAGGRIQPRRTSSNGSDVSSIDLCIGLGTGHAHRGTARQAGPQDRSNAPTQVQTTTAAALRSSGGVSGGMGDGVHTQIASLQTQLALLGEQLTSTYRAAEGVVSPSHAAAPATAAASSALGDASISFRGGAFGAGGLASPGRGGAQGFMATTFRPITPTRHTMGSGAGGAEGDVGLTSSRMRQLAAEERAGREAVAREDERLRIWIQDLRSERRRLEDQLLDGEPGALRVQAMRDELEKQVLSLSRQRDQLSGELSELGVTRSANSQLALQVESLDAALAAETERVHRYKEVRPAIEARLAELSGSLDALRQQHSTALELLGRERDAAALKAKRATRRAVELEAALSTANEELKRADEELHVRSVALAEVRASSDVLQAAGQQMQANLELQIREAAARHAAVQSRLEDAQSEATILRRQLEASQHEAAGLREQLRDAASRQESLRTEVDRLAGRLAEEQGATATARQQAESLQGQLANAEAGRAEGSKASAAQLEALRRQHAGEITTLQKQYESQLAASDKQYLLLQRQYDAGLSASEKAAEGMGSLRRERDALWAEAENLRAELEAVRREKGEVSAKLAALRAEVRATMDEVARDRDARLAVAASQGDALVRDIKAEAEHRIAAVKQEYESRLSGLMDATEKARGEAAEAQRQADKARATVAHLKEQVRDLLLSRDGVERELASERTFNEELNRILAAIRAEQQAGAAQR